MSPEPFDRDALGFAISVVGMVICVAGAGLWSCWV